MQITFIIHKTKKSEVNTAWKLAIDFSLESPNIPDWSQLVTSFWAQLHFLGEVNETGIAVT